MIKSIVLLALPVMIANLLQTSVMAIDTYMIGRLGPISIAGVGMGNTLRGLLLIAVLSVSGGAISLIAQAKGSRDPKRMSFVTRQAIVSGIMLSIVLAGFGFLVAWPLLQFMDSGDNQEATSLACSYLSVLLLGMPFLVLNVVMNRLMQGAGDTLTPLLLTFLMVGLNIGLNALFIFGGWGLEPMGVIGAALGTVIARGIIVIISYFIFKSGKNVIQILAGSWQPDPKMIRDILSIGIPSGIQGVFRHGGVLVLMALVTATELETYGAAVLAIGFQLEQLAIQVVVGINVAATSIVGQQIGKWQIREAFHRGNLMIVMGSILMTFLIIPIIFFGRDILLAFEPSANEIVLTGGLSFIQINISCLPFAAIAIVLTGALRGTGDTLPSMRSAILNRNLLTIGAAYFLAFILDWGSNGIWWGIVLGRVSDTLYVGIVWIRKKWIQTALAKSEIYSTHLQYLSIELQNQFLKEIRAPQMAIEGMVEIVGPHTVIYKNASNEISIHFSKNTYSI